MVAISRVFRVRSMMGGDCCITYDQETHESQADTANRWKAVIQNAVKPPDPDAYHEKTSPVNLSALGMNLRMLKSSRKDCVTYAANYRIHILQVFFMYYHY